MSKLILIATQNPKTSNYLADVISEIDKWRFDVPAHHLEIPEILNRGDVHLTIIDANWLKDEILDILNSQNKITSGFIVILNQATEIEALNWMRKGAGAFLHEPVNEITPETLTFILKSIFRTRKIGQDTARKIQVNNLDGAWITMNAPSNIAALEQFQRFFMMLHSTALTDDEKRMIHLAINEIGMNAIEWVNKKDNSRQLLLSYAFFPDKIAIRIEDEGEGFSPSKLPNPVEIGPSEVVKQRCKEGKRLGGYGLTLVRNIMTKVQFNERGNIVYMEKKLSYSGKNRSFSTKFFNKPYNNNDDDTEF